MDLTPDQRKLLVQYSKLRFDPGARPGLLKPLLPMILPIAALTAVSAATLPAPVTAFAAGLGLGGILRQAALQWRARRVLPVLLEAMDWGRVADLLGEAPPRPS